MPPRQELGRGPEALKISTVRMSPLGTAVSPCSEGGEEQVDEPPAVPCYSQADCQLKYRTRNNQEDGL